ncbi:MAG: molybdopterin-dependent oxidoreductase [Ardenticatenaceae bacterium]
MIPEQPFSWVKPCEHLIRHADSLETPAELLSSFITPAEHFFVCRHVGTPIINPAEYVLEVTGDAIERPLKLSFEDILRLPTHTLISYLECAGSQRNLFKEVIGQEARSDDFAMTPWMLGGVGNAIWTGVSLRTILEMAGVKANAVDVNAKGLDKEAPEGGVSRPIPIQKALDPDTILAYLMNGEPLLPDHGFPVRLLVPGWIGSNSVKWVGSITVSSRKVWVNRNTKHYVFMGPEWPEEEYAPAWGGTITTQNVKSSIALPWNATIQAGKNLIRGVARSPHARIAKVEWQAVNEAGEKTGWQDANLIPPFIQYAWVRFELEWDAPPGRWAIMTRATDEDRHTQPDTIPFNREGYLFNQVYPHPLIVQD